jgi:osmotically-inducible protein OsmY
MDTRIILTASLLPLALAACSPDGADRVAKQSNQIADTTTAAVKDAGRKIERAADEARKFGASDAAITTSIKADLLKDPALSAIKIEVETRDGVVTLNGVAPDAAAAARAGRIANAIAGVKDVRNHVVVKQG